jgi:hypothetical protein
VGVAGYTVFRNGTQVGTATYPSFQDIGLSASASYTYTLRAFESFHLPVETSSWKMPPESEVPPDPVGCLAAALVEVEDLLTP